MDAEEAERREAASASECDGDGPPAGAGADSVAAGSAGRELPEAGKAQTFDGLGSRIDALKREQAEILARKKQCMKDLKNAERRRRRLKKKARNLSVDDLKQLLDMRGPVEVEQAAAVGQSAVANAKKKQKKSKDGVVE